MHKEARIVSYFMHLNHLGVYPPVIPAVPASKEAEKVRLPSPVTPITSPTQCKNFDNPMLRNPLLMLSQWLLHARPQTIPRVFEKASAFEALKDEERIWLQNRAYSTLGPEDILQCIQGTRSVPNVFITWEKQVVSSEYGAYKVLAQTPVARCFSLSVPSEEALNALKKCGPICELGAGTGYWAALLRARGVDVVAYDIQPPRPPSDKEPDPGPVLSAYGEKVQRKEKKVTTPRNRTSNLKEKKMGKVGNGLTVDIKPRVIKPYNLHCGQHVFAPVLAGDGIEIAGTDMATERALLLVWPYNKSGTERTGLTMAEVSGRLEAWDAHALANYRGRLVCLVGELDKRPNARKGHSRSKSNSFSSSFQTALYRDFELKHSVRLPPLVLGSFDELTIWKRKTWNS